MFQQIKLRRVSNEMRLIEENYIWHGITCALKAESTDENIQLLTTIPGPIGSPFQGYTLKLKVEFGSEYPLLPPDITFITKVFHPNIGWADGKISLNLLRPFPTGSYSPCLTLEHILKEIKMLLGNPHTDGIFNFDAAHLYKTDRLQYIARARLVMQDNMG